MPRFQFEYLHRDTPIHRMHCISKLVLLLTIASLGSIWMDPRYIILPFIFTLIIWYIAKIPKMWLAVPILFTLGTQWGMILFTYPFLEYSFRTLPPEYANQVLFDLGYIPTVGHMVFTVGSVWYAISYTLKYFLTTAAAMLIYFTTRISDIVQYLLKFKKIPSTLIFSIIIIFKFVPVMTKLGYAATNAMQLRGWSAKTRNPVKFIKAMFPMLHIISRQFMVSVDMVSISLANRAFGVYPMVPWKEMPMKKLDYIIVIGCIISIVVAYYLAIVPPYIGNL